MAISATILQDAIMEVRRVQKLKFQENEVRRSAYGALEAVKLGTEMLVPGSELSRMKEASAQTTSIDTFSRTADGAGTARACSGTGDATTSTTSLVYQTLAETFKLSEIEAQGNRTKAVEIVANQLMQKLRSLTNRKNDAVITFLEANAVATGGTFGATVGNSTQITAANRLNYFNQMKTNLMENDFFGGYDNVHSFSQGELVRFDEAQGGANGTNLAFQLGDYSHFASTGITNIALVESTSYLFERGTVGVVDWVAPLYRSNRREGEHFWTTMDDPFGLLGNIEVKMTTSCVDNSASIAGAEADLETSWVLTTEFAILKAFTSTADTGIYGGEVLA